MSHAQDLASCEGKRVFRSFAQAAYKQKKARAYHCAVCGGYHRGTAIGHPGRLAKKRIQRIREQELQGE